MKKRKKYVGLILICSIALIVGIKSVYAYYYEDSESLNVVDTQVADIYPSFEKSITSADIDMRVRVYTTVSSGVYTGSYNVPKNGQIKDVKCTNDNQAPSSSNTVTCSNGSSTNGGCYYIYDSVAGTITLENAGKATCSFYF